MIFFFVFKIPKPPHFHDFFVCFELTLYCQKRIFTYKFSQFDEFFPNLFLIDFSEIFFCFDFSDEIEFSRSSRNFDAFFQTLVFDEFKLWKRLSHDVFTNFLFGLYFTRELKVVIVIFTNSNFEIENHPKFMQIFELTIQDKKKIRQNVGLLCVAFVFIIINFC